MCIVYDVYDKTKFHADSVLSNIKRKFHEHECKHCATQLVAHRPELIFIRRYLHFRYSSDIYTLKKRLLYSPTYCRSYNKMFFSPSPCILC